MAGAVSREKLAAPVFLLQTDFFPEVSPLSRLCEPVCGFFQKGKETAPALLPAPVGPFCGAFEKAEFLRSVWVIQASRVKISYTNPLHLMSSIAHPKEWFSPENGGDTWGRK